MIKKIIPSTLIGRSIIIIFVPIIIIVLITSFVFYQTSWSIISKRLTESVAADINVLVKLINSDLINNAINIANQDFKMKINIINDKQLLSSKFSLNSGILSNRLNQSLSNLKKKFDYDLSNLEEGVLIYIQIEEDVFVLFWQFTIQVIQELDIVVNQNLSVEMFLIRLMYLKSIPSSAQININVEQKKENSRNNMDVKNETSLLTSKAVEQIKNIAQEEEKKKIDLIFKRVFRK